MIMSFEKKVILDYLNNNLRYKRIAEKLNISKSNYYKYRNYLDKNYSDYLLIKEIFDQFKGHNIHKKQRILFTKELKKMLNQILLIENLIQIAQIRFGQQI